MARSKRKDGEPDLVAADDRRLEAELHAKFKDTYQDTRGGARFSYITGGQCALRLTETLGVWGWQFEIVEHGIFEDEVWVRGRLTVYHPTDPTRHVVREQFGSDKIKRRTSDQSLLDIGFNLKGAATDCLKKAASLVGVALYLSKDPNAEALPDEGEPAPVQQPRNVTLIRATPARSSMPAETASGAKTIPTTCEACGAPLLDVLKNGELVWDGARLEREGRKYFGQALCIEHFKQAKATKKAQAAAAAQSDALVLPDGTLNRAVLVARYGEKVAGQVGQGYVPPTPQDKSSFYAAVSKHLGYTRTDIYHMVGLNPETQHLEAWLIPWQTAIGGLRNVAFLHFSDPEGTRVPTLADLPAPTSKEA